MRYRWAVLAAGTAAQASFSAVLIGLPVLAPALRDEFDRWDTLLAGLHEAQVTAPEFAENWSIKDMVAHLWDWQQRSIARLEAALHDREPIYPAWPTQFDPEAEGQPHDLNAWLYEQHRDQPWPSVYQNWRTGFLRVLELVEAIPQEDLLAVGRYPWLEGYVLLDVLRGTCEHHHEHAEQLRHEWIHTSATLVRVRLGGGGYALGLLPRDGSE